VISKKLLLVSVCFVVLFGAVGAYSYLQISSLRSQVDSLQKTISSLEDEIEELQEEIDRLQNESSHVNSTTFVFEYPSLVQNVVNGTLRMELTFSWNEENLSIIAKINDDEYSWLDYLGLIFEPLEHGGLMLFAENFTISGALQSNGFLAYLAFVPEPTNFHRCFFQPSIGYTFNFSIPFSTLGTQSDLIYVCFFDANCSDGVYVCFHFRTP